MKCRLVELGLLVAVSSVAFCVACPTTCAALLSPGPRTVDVERGSYGQLLYVSQTIGSDDTGDGSERMPWKSIQHALAVASDSSARNRIAILVAAGIYREPTLRLRPYVDLYGGFQPEQWRRDIIQFATILDGSKQRRVLIGADHTRLDGFIVRQGLVRGRGAGILCEGSSPTITNNRFIENRTKKTKNWAPEFWHETTNDGAAIYCRDRAQPIIRHNVFAENRTEIGRGAAIAMHGYCAGEIVHCVFLDNATGTEDHDRSSDGGAVSVFDWSSPRIENNVFLENKAYNSNDGGALFVALWSSPTIKRNLFVGNRSTDDGGALFIGGQEHRYDKPKDRRPAEEDFLVRVSDNLFLGNENRKRNSGGIRVTMEARATLQYNIMARDARLFVQDSAVEIVNNTILEDTILRKMPQNTAADLLANNIFWGRLVVGKRRSKQARKAFPDIRPGLIGSKPRFVHEQETFQVTNSTHLAALHVTEVQVGSNHLEEDRLANRAVRFKRRWGVVKSNHADKILVWGDVTENSELVVLPTYKIHPDWPSINGTANSGAFQ